MKIYVRDENKDSVQTRVRKYPRDVMSKNYIARKQLEIRQ